MRKTEVQGNPVTHATVSLHRSSFHPEKVDITLKLTITELKVIKKTMSEAEINPFLEKYGLSAVELTSLDTNSHRQITEIIEYPQGTKVEEAAQRKVGKKIRS